MRRSWMWLVLVGGVWGCGSRDGAAPQAESTLPLLSIPASTNPEVKKALGLLSEGQAGDAIAAATAAISRSPEDASLYDARAHIFHRLGQIDAAMTDLHRAVQLDPKNARYLNNRGFLLLGQHQIDAAFADFNQAHTLDPELVSAYNNRALVEITRGRYRQALVDLEEALKRDPKYVDALNNRGFALMQLGRLDRALADFNAAVTLSPKYTNAWNNRGLVKRQLGDLDGAMLDFTQAMLLDPNNPKYYDHRKDVYLLQGEMQKAKEDERKIHFLMTLRALSESIQRAPREPAPYLARAEHFRQQGDDAAARRDFDRAVEFAAKTDSVVILRRAAFLRDCKEFAAAVTDCDAVLANGAHQLAWSIRGDCRKALRDYEGAIQDYEAAKRLDEAVIETYSLKAEDLSRRGDVTEADRLRTKAEQLSSVFAQQQTESATAQPFPADGENVDIKRTAAAIQPLPE
ncbi:MAG TPA: tetratricopeptide repeat protein [Planctomycetaceae bacterium]|nr:tetratricopeptide repeat protein [Planctomycetaceae bacterium]